MSVRWSQDEVEFLFDKCGIVPNKAIADRLGRSPHAIRQKLSRNSTSIFDNIYCLREEIDCQPPTAKADGLVPGATPLGVRDVRLVDDSRRKGDNLEDFTQTRVMV